MNTTGSDTGARERIAREVFKVIHHWESWDDFDARLEARGGEYHPSQKLAFAVADAILASLPAAEGAWVLVPREPTEAMLEAGMGAFMAAHDRMFSANEPTGPIYRAMLSAAPSSDGERG